MGYHLKGCFSLFQPQQPQPPSIQHHVEPLSSIDSLQSCFVNCSSLDSLSWFYLSSGAKNASGGTTPNCSCFYAANNSSNINQFLSSIPSTACDAMCLSNQFPCGSSVNSSIISVYDITSRDSINITDPSSVIGGNGQVNTNPSVTTVTVYNPAVDQAPLQTRIALYIAAGLGSLLVGFLLFYYLRRRKVIRETPSLPRLNSFKKKGTQGAAGTTTATTTTAGSTIQSPTSPVSPSFAEKLVVSGGALQVNQRSDSLSTLSSSSTTPPIAQEYLIPHILPKIPSQIYTARTVYQPVRADEIAVGKGDVVQVLKIVQKAQWAIGNNLSSGNRGMFPLVCLVDLAASASGSGSGGAVVFPSRRI